MWCKFQWNIIRYADDTILLGESEQEETRTSEANKMQHRMIIHKTKTISNGKVKLTMNITVNAEILNM